MKPRSALPLVVVIALVTGLLRIVPHHPNMAALGALSLVAGMYAPGLLAFAIPLTVIVLTDAVIGFYTPSIMVAVYVSYLLMIGIGAVTRRLTGTRSVPVRSLAGIAGAGLGSVIFFLLTNAAVWQWGMLYQHTFSGLLQSYINGLPFFRNSLTSDLAYAAIFIISIEALLRVRIFQTKTKHATLVGE